MSNKTTKDTVALLTETRAKYEARRREIEADEAKEIAKLMEGAKLEIANAFNAAATIYEGIPADARNGILTDPALADMLKALGLTIAKGRKSRSAGTGTRKPRSSVTPEKVLEYIKDNSVSKDLKTTGAIEKHFDTNSNTLSKALNALQKSGKIKKDEKRSPWYAK